MKVGCYVRVSTQEQAKEGYSIGAQTDRLKNYCLARDWNLYRIYTDPGYSGAKMERPALKQLISDVENHRIDLVLVYKLDRLSRSQKDTLYLIEDVFMKNDVAFVSLNENFDTSTAFGRAIVGMLSVFAQLEREQIKERSQMGRIERAKEGLWKGGGYVPIGYTYDAAANQLLIQEYEAMQVRECYDLYVNKRLSITKVTKTLHDKGYRYKCGAWEHTSAAMKVLTNSIYIGEIKWNGGVYQGQHTPIIAPELFYAAQNRLEERRWNKDGKLPKKSPFQATQLLSGLLFCKVCGARYYGAGAYRGSHDVNSPNRKYVHLYSCYSRTKTRKEMIRDPNCKNKNWKADELDQYITNQIRRLCIDESYFEELVSNGKPPAPAENNREIILSQIQSLEEQITKMLDLYQYGNIPTEKIAERLEALTEEKHKLTNSLPGEPQKPRGLTIEESRAILSNAVETLDTGSLEEKRDMLQSLIERIDIDYDNVTIVWNFF